MNKRVEGIYPNVEEALQAVDRLRDQGYTRDAITLVANEEIQGRFSSNVDANITTEDRSMDRVDEETTSQVTDTHTNDNRSMDRADNSEEDKSFWDSVKDAFTFDNSSADDSDYIAEEDPVYEYRDVISQGQVAVLISGDPEATDLTSKANIQPNTIGPDGVRTAEEEQNLGSRDEYLKDPEMTTDELDDYERRQ
ncbi:hypothetical protein AAK882_06745 [Carnobacteriaceae bacterium 52-44]